MRLSRVRAQVRQKISDVTVAGDAGQQITDRQLDRYIDLQVQSLSRQRADADSSYNLVTFAIAATDTARVSQRHETSWRYVLPSWVHTIAFVREDMSAQNLQGKAVVPLGFEGADCGWFWESDHAIAVVGFATAPDLIFFCQRIPTPLHAGTCPRAAAAANTLPLDTETNIGEAFDSEDGAFLGAQFEITGGQTSSRDPRGRISTVIGQTRAWDSTLSEWITELTLQPPPAAQIASSDTYEMHVQLQASEITYLVLLVAEQFWQEKHNVNAINAIQDDLEREERRFIDGIQPRQDMAPAIQEPGASGFPGFGDRDPLVNDSYYL